MNRSAAIRSVTIKDVAQRAGCGIATVSRVLNRTGPASVSTQERVREAANALGFEFSEIGRSLQSNKTKTIGCVVPSLVNPVFADAVHDLQTHVLAAGYQLLLICSNYSPELELEAIRMLLAKRVDGLVLTVSDAAHSEGLSLVRQRSIPCSLMFNAPAAGFPAIYVDNFAAARRVGEEFAKAGHIHTGFLALSFNSSDRSQQRFEGFCEACAAYGIESPVLLEIDEGDGSLLEKLRDLLQENHDLTGIFASNDFLALATMRAARALGRFVPEDLAIVGFDGIEIGEMVEPSLATIVTNPARMGLEAAKTVLRAVHSGEPEAGENDMENSGKLNFSFRHGGSLAPPGAGKAGDGTLKKQCPTSSYQTGSENSKHQE